MKNIKLVKINKIDDGVYKTNIWGIEKDGVVYVRIYQGCKSWYRCILNKNKEWYYVVQYVKDGAWEYEHYKKFKEAKERGIEIVKRR
jgi:pyruvate/2-oxoacid:ferredoxin oxidoreductase beta subunit